MTVRKRNGRWQVDFVWRYPDGRRERIRRAVPVNTKREAELFESQLRTRLLAGGSIEEESEQRLRFRDWVSKAMAHAELHNKPRTVAWKRDIFERVLTPHFGAMRLDEIDTEAIEDFKAERIAAGRQPATVNRELQVLSKALSLAVEAKLMKVAPRMQKLRERPAEREWLSDEEASVFLEGVGTRWRPMVLFALRTGLRIGELIALRWSDVDKRRQSITVRRSISNGIEGTPKGGRFRTIPLSTDALAVLEQQPRRGVTVFCGEDGKPWSQVSAQWSFRRASKLLGKRVGWHTLRHSFASQLVESGVPLPVVKELCGHDDIRTTMLYVHLGGGSLRSAIETMERKNPLRAGTSEGIHVTSKAQGLRLVPQS